MDEVSPLDATPVAAKSNKILICRQDGCFDMSTVAGFCRLHYLANWKKLKSKEAKKKGQDLEAYLSELSNRFPDEFLEKLKIEVEDLSHGEEQAEEAPEKPHHDNNEGDEDIDTIIKGIRIEDF